MSTLVDGSSVIVAGLDHWYVPDGSGVANYKEFEEHDWRLEQRLNVSSFRLPPDYRAKGNDQDAQNLRLTIPALRFPTWHLCSSCNRLIQQPLTLSNRPRCPDPSHENWKAKPRMSQVPLVTLCSHDHLDDFPFNEWVHRTPTPTCQGPLRLKSSGAGGLTTQRVSCDGCGRQRSLAGITQAAPAGDVERTNLSSQLSSSEEPFLCRGARPWLAEWESHCDRPIRAALRGASNVYFPQVESSIFLPATSERPSPADRLLEFPATLPVLRDYGKTMGGDVSAMVLRMFLQMALPSEVVQEVSDEDLLALYTKVRSRDSQSNNASERTGHELSPTDEWRFPEFVQIRALPKHRELVATDPGLHIGLRPYFQRVRSVDVLRETRALRGFTRLHDRPTTVYEGKKLLRRACLDRDHDWLPAYVVKGEGIYLELDDDKLGAWETRPEVIARVKMITDNYGEAQGWGGKEREITGRSILIHTLAHLLINQLVFTSGYSSASLRERMYVSTHPDRKMGALLIYTAAGDSEGTMGGLVRQSRPDNLFSLMAHAVAKAKWCATDPVCMESKGQGPDSCNLAACHACALLPETSCEEFNRFLDRALVVGTFENPSLGYFTDLA